MNTSHFKNSITSIPTFLSGVFTLYEIYQSEGHYPKELIREVFFDDEHVVMPYEALSLTDRARFAFETRENKIVSKIRIALTPQITTNNVVKIGDAFFKVFNIYHFENKDGYKLSDITLEMYFNEEMEE